MSGEVSEGQYYELRRCESQAMLDVLIIVSFRSDWWSDHFIVLDDSW